MNSASHLARQVACSRLTIRPIGTSDSRSMVTGQNFSTGIRFVLPTTCSMNATTSKKPGQLK